MRAINCFICGSERSKTVDDQLFKDPYLDLINPVYQNLQRRLAVCQECGFVYHDPQLDSVDIAVLYDKFRDSSFRNETPDEYFDRITSLPREQSENYAKIQWIRAHLGFAGNSHSLLDIGCGGGVFMHTFLDRSPGWTACGIEPTPAFAELAGRRLNVPVITGTYRPGLFEGKRFDLIAINQVLEHVIDPVEFLKDVRNDLADDGYVYIEVPDILDLLHLPPAHDRFLMPHLWVFSESSLTDICWRAGYEVRVVDHLVTVRHKRNLIVLLTKQTSSSVQNLLLRDDPEWVLSLRRQYRDAVHDSDQ